MNTSCGDTVKCRLDAGKSPIFRSQSPCTYIYTYLVATVLGFRAYIYTYENTKGLNVEGTFTSCKLFHENSRLADWCFEMSKQQMRCYR